MCSLARARSRAATAAARLFPRDALDVHEDTQQLGDRERWVRVVQLDGHLWRSEQHTFKWSNSEWAIEESASSRTQ